MVIDINEKACQIILYTLQYTEAEDPYADYEIELGVGVWNQIICESGAVYSNMIIHNKDEKTMLYGKTVRINYDDPYIFKLWKCVL